LIGVKAPAALRVVDGDLQEADMSGPFDDDDQPSIRESRGVSLLTWALAGGVLLAVYVLALVLLQPAR
jgi:hypothetical protein